MTFRENRFIPGMNKHNLINISDYEPSFVGRIGCKSEEQ